ncbi:MAG: hypothetical protein QNJ35_13550 [Paracoccaceae bacterium]|nr:hypothetical protein [Paracoccaceae bacterium]
MKQAASIILTTAGLGLSAASVAAQEVNLAFDRGERCAVPGTDLYTYLQATLPDCSRFCTVDASSNEELEGFQGFVFACADDSDGGAIALDGAGLARGAVAIGLIGLLLGATTQDGGSANSTTGN